MASFSRVLVLTSVVLAVAFACGGLSIDECGQTTGCQWVQQDICENSEDCSALPPAQCKADKACLYHPEQAGSCQSQSFGCGNRLSQRACVRGNRFCQWTSDVHCVPILPFVVPNCASLSAAECSRNSAFCDLSGQCYDNPRTCGNLNKDQCLAHPNLCHYTVTRKDSCRDNTAICANLSALECKHNKRCQYQQTSKDTCVNELNCSQFPATQCPSSLCQVSKTPFVCSTPVPAPNHCAQYTSAQCALDRTCSISAAGSCVSNVFCESIIDEVLCQQYSALGYCNYAPSSATCSNTIDCSQLGTSADGTVRNCQDQPGCLLIHGQGICKPLKYGCAQLSPQQCLRNKYCVYTQERGFCQNLPFGCENLSPQECLHNRRCLLESQCTQKQLPTCNQLSLTECQASKYCRLQDKGHCNDRKFDCPTSNAAGAVVTQDECLAHKFCQWTPANPFSCENRYDCPSLNQKECLLNPSICLGSSQAFCAAISG